ncbi:MAG: rRNA adenine dimethyltransferase family protein [bacterium]
MQRNSVKYSQNFLKDPQLINRLIKNAGITDTNIIIEIGPGTGMITRELDSIAGKVTAIEKNESLYLKLIEDKKKGEFGKTIFAQGDFLDYKLPAWPYKVFANIPFNVTSDIINKLTDAINPPDDCFLIVQREAAERFCGKKETTQISALLYPFFEMDIVYFFSKEDFNPIPNVNIVLLRIKKRKEPLVVNKIAYRDFIAYSFNAFKPTLKQGLRKVFSNLQFKILSKNIGFYIEEKPTELKFKQWLQLFEFFEKNMKYERKIFVKGAYNKSKTQSQNIEKNYRTRLIYKKPL